MKIAQVGTFNVNNLGDQLFPIVFSEIIKGICKENGKQIQVDHYSPDVKGYKPLYTDEKPVIDIKSLRAKDYDLIFIGGGDLIRADDWSINSIYKASDELSFTNIVSPTDESCRNMVTLGVGIPFEFDSAFEIYVKNSFSRCLKISVRDQECFRSLTESGISCEIVPDIVLSISRYFPKEKMKNKLMELISKHPVSVQDPYIVFQANGNVIKANEIEPLSIMLNEISDDLGVQICLLSIGECLGDNQLTADLSSKLKKCFIVNQETIPDITLMEKVAVLANSRGFIGSSLHGNVISYSYRIPHITFSCDYSRKLKGFYELTRNSMGYGTPFDMFEDKEKIISFFSKGDPAAERDVNEYIEVIRSFITSAINVEKESTSSFSSQIDLLYKENQRFLLNKLHENEQLWLRVNTSEMKSKEIELQNAELWKRVDNAEELNRTLVMQNEELNVKMSVNEEKTISLGNQNRELHDKLNITDDELRLLKKEYESLKEINGNYSRQINELEDNLEKVRAENNLLLGNFIYYIKSRYKKGT